MVFNFWLILSCLFILLSFTNAANYLCPDGSTYNTEDTNSTRDLHDRVVLCGVNSWKSYNSEADVVSLNLTLCTHVVYRIVSYASKTKLVHWGSSDPDGEHEMKTVLNFRKQYSHLRFLLEISIDAKEDNNLFSDGESRLASTETAIKFMKKYSFDGIVIRLRTPALEGDYSKVADDLFDFIKTISNELRKEKLPLTLIIRTGDFRRLVAYNIRRVIEYVDFFTLLVSHPEKYLQTFFPLYCVSKEDQYCLDCLIRTHILLGIPMNKVLVSLGFYSHEVKTDDEKTIHIGISKPHGEQIDYLNPETCKQLAEPENAYKFYWDGLSHCPYAHSYKKKKILTYETPRSLIHKIRFAMKFDVRGIYTDTINYDDIYGKCPSDLYENKYKDIEHDFTDLKSSINVQKLLPLLNFPGEATVMSQHREWPQIYIKEDKTLNLLIPKNENKNQPLLRSLITGIVYAEQELAVEKAFQIKRQCKEEDNAKKGQEITQNEPRDACRGGAWQIFANNINFCN